MLNVVVLIIVAKIKRENMQMFKLLKFVVILIGTFGLLTTTAYASFIQTMNGAYSSPGQYGTGCRHESYESILSGTDTYYHRYNNTQYDYFETFEPPEDLNRSRTQAICEFIYDGVYLNTITSTSEVDLTAAEIKLQSHSSPSVMTTAESTYAFGTFFDVLYFPDTALVSPFRVDITLNYEGALWQQSNALITFSANAFSFYHLYLSPVIADDNIAVCTEEVYRDLYTCDENVISELITFSFYSDKYGDFIGTTLADGNTASILSLGLTMQTQAFNLGAAQFNQSSWLNVTVTEGVSWYTETGALLTNPRANLQPNVNNINSPGTLIMLVLGLVILLNTRRFNYTLLS